MAKKAAEEIIMPKVKKKSGKIVHYPYTKKGKAAAKKAAAKNKSVKKY